MWFVFQIAVTLGTYWFLQTNLDPTQDYGYAPGAMSVGAALVATVFLGFLIDKAKSFSERLRFKRDKPANSVGGLLGSWLKPRNPDKLIDTVGSRKNLR